MEIDPSLWDQVSKNHDEHLKKKKKIQYARQTKWEKLRRKATSREKERLGENKTK